jgi:predicted dehydrogenase
MPAGFHAEIGLLVLDANKHLLMEKPLALSLDDCDRLIERARRASCIATINFNLRRHRFVRKAREMVRQGALGKIKLIRTALFCGTHHVIGGIDWRKHRELGGGALVETIVHDFDLWRFLLGSEVEEVFAMSLSEECDDEAVSITAIMDNGVLVSASSVEQTAGDHEIEIVGSAGRLEFSLYCFDGLGLYTRPCIPGDFRARLDGVARTLKELPRALLRQGRGGVWGDTFRDQWRHFIECIQQQKPPECTLDDGKRALEAVLAAAESASVGRPVKVAEAPNELRPANRMRCNKL